MGTTVATKVPEKRRAGAMPEPAPADDPQSKQTADVPTGLPLFLQRRAGGGCSSSSSGRHLAHEHYAGNRDIPHGLTGTAESASSQAVRRKCADCEEEEQLQMKNAGGTQAGGEAPEVVHYALGAPWQPLDPETRAHMETRFGHDLGHVRIHTDDRAAQSARAIRARAYTIGSDIVFGRSQFQPATKQGQFLLAHELTHVVQQDSSRAHRQADESSLPADAAQAGPSSPSAQNNSIATQRLLAIIADIERLQAGTASMDADTVEGNAGQLSRFVDQLRAVANGGDENLKLQVLAGFNSVGVQQAELQLSNPDAQVQQETPAGVAAKSLEVSDPRDAAEVEADRVADAIVNGSPAAVALTTSASLVNRQLGPALVGAGTGILTLEVESTPATSWNPPGWVILGVATLIAAGLITAGILMAENVGDTGIMDEVNQLIQGAKAAGTALSICEALAQLMNAAKQAGDTQRMQRIKKTQKAKGCRHSTFS